ncbi:MAG: Pr6Pr family membrane protein [Taibaiella sp.]|nr:Pr6Pr family membrane protein [Taibaiella sp.]
MKKKISVLIAVTAWAAVIIQYWLMLQHRTASIPETTIRFFSFFTILTNSLVAVYFTLSASAKEGKPSSIIHQPGTLTAVTVYITVVGLVYQFVLRQTWNPEGLQKIVDELLHSVVPLSVIVFWYFYEDKLPVKYLQISRWLIYPLVYLIYILVRGHFSVFYPYPFVNVADIGFAQVLVNSVLITALFIGISALLIRIGKWIARDRIQ